MAGVSMADSGGARGKKSLDMQLPLVPFMCSQCKGVTLIKRSRLAGKQVCSRKCTTDSQRGKPKPSSVGNSYAFRGDMVTRWAYHKRANKMRGEP